MTSYCPIQHLAMSLHPCRTWGDTIMGMFTAYFDASGQEHEHPYMVVAGFVSSVTAWLEFSEEWKAVLGQYGIKTFHATDCQNWKGEFKDWKGQDNKRLRLWHDLIGVIKKTQFQKFGIGIEVKDWNESFTAERKRQSKINAYVLCSLACAERVMLWARRQYISTPIEYIYESGDPGSGQLKGHFDEMEYPAPSFKHKEDRMIGGIFYPATIPLQAADFLAYEIFLTKKIFRKNASPSFGRPMHEFKDMPEAIKLYSGDKLKELEETFDFPRKVRGIWRPF